MPEGKVLVVDDNEIVLELVRMHLEDQGFEVETVQSAFQMPQAIRNAQPDVILLDVKMPALRGDKAARILAERSFSKHIPVVLFSDLDEAELAALVAETGAAGFVRKTANAELLANVIRSHMETAGRP